MSVCCLALSHRGTILASGSTDTKVKLWKMDIYAEMHDLSGEGGFVNALDFSIDDVYLYTGSNDGRCHSYIVLYMAKILQFIILNAIIIIKYFMSKHIT